MNVEVVDSGHVTRDDAAYPTLVGLDDGSIICGYSCGGGSSATGGTEWARSTDGGTTWTREGTILARTESPVTTNTLRLSRTAGGTILAYGARRYDTAGTAQFGRDPSEPVLCRSRDGGRTWSAPVVLAAASADGQARGYEATCPILALDEERWLAPAGLLADAGSLGERVIVFSSPDAGQTWPHSHTVFHDADARRCFFETKVISLGSGRLLAVAWTVTAGDYQDLDNQGGGPAPGSLLATYALSRDGGRTWTGRLSHRHRGQTMTPVWLGGDRLLVLYNRRYGKQGIVMLVVQVADDGWIRGPETMLWDAAAAHRGVPRSRRYRRVLRLRVRFAVPCQSVTVACWQFIGAESAKTEPRATIERCDGVRWSPALRLAPSRLLGVCAPGSLDAKVLKVLSARQATCRVRETGMKCAHTRGS